MGFRAHIVSFQDKILFCSKIEDLLTWLKCFQSYLHDSVIILASKSLLRPKKQDFKENFPKCHLEHSCLKPFNYQCDLCDAEYVGYTSQYLHQRVDEHCFSAIGKHLKNNTALKLSATLLVTFPSSRNATEN